VQVKPYPFFPDPRTDTAESSVSYPGDLQYHRDDGSRFVRASMLNVEANLALASRAFYSHLHWHIW
jgi:hypothetical protein